MKEKSECSSKPVKSFGAQMQNMLNHPPNLHLQKLLKLNRTGQLPVSYTHLDVYKRQYLLNVFLETHFTFEHVCKKLK